MKFFFHDMHLPGGKIPDRHGELGEVKISGSFAETVDGAVDPADAAFDSGKGVGTRQIVVVVAVKITAQLREGGAYEVECGTQVGGIKSAQSIAEHKTLNGQIFEGTDLCKDIVKGVVDPP